MKNNILGYVLFILGNLFLMIGIHKLSISQNDSEVGFALIFLIIAIIEGVLGLILILKKNKNQ